MKNYLFSLLCVFLFSSVLAQYPRYFGYDDESGLPSNEVYSIVEDSKGFIWLGCDAGLFKFDGYRYNPYDCKTQKSRSITGLNQSVSGRIYGFNFQSQLFYVEGDSLYELKHELIRISNIACDARGNLFLNHEGGIAVYNERLSQWKNYSNFGKVTRDEKKYSMNGQKSSATEQSRLSKYKKPEFEVILLRS